MRVVSYNARGLRLGQTAADKARRLVVDKLLEETDILCIQETFISKQDLDKLNSVNSNFHGAGESTTDLSLGLVQGRIPGGVAILWHKKYDPLISVIRLGVDWCIAIKVACNNKVFIIINVYTPYESHNNEDLYLERLAFLNAFIEETEYSSIYLMGDLNADISDEKSLFGRHLTQFCHDNKLILTSSVLLPATTFTYVSEAWNTTSWLDHIICTADAHDCVEQVEILYGLAASDHMPVSIMLKVENLPDLVTNENYRHGVKLQWARLSEDDLRFYHDNTEKNLGKIKLPYEAILCNNINCDNSIHKYELCIMYNLIVNGLNQSSNVFSKKRCNHKLRPGWNEHIDEIHQQARETFKVWVNACKPRSGPECDSKSML